MPATIHPFPTYLTSLERGGCTDEPLGKFALGLPKT